MSTLNKINALKSEKLAFYDWVFKWAANNNSSTENVNVDIPQIAAVLQAFGFKLECIDQPFKDNPTENDTLEIKMELKCNQSGTRAVLTKKMDSCLCPTSEKANEGIFWILSGSGPSTSQDNINKIDESHSNLVPSISKEKSSMIKDIITKVFSMISETDVNQNQNKYQVTPTSRNTLKARSHSDLNRPSLTRSDTWEVDPKISPPTGTSSPLPEHAKSINQVLHSDKEQLLSDILYTVKENLEKALVLLPQNNNTFTKTNMKRVSNIKASPTVTTPTRSTTGKSTPDLPKRCTPKKKINDTPKSALSGKRLLCVASKIGSFRKNSDTLTTHSPAIFKSKLTKAESMTNINKKPISPGVEPKKLTIKNSSPTATSPGIRRLKQTSFIPGPKFLSGKSNAIATTTKKLK